MFENIENNTVVTGAENPAPQQLAEAAATPAPQQIDVPRTYMSREEYVAKFGDDRGYIPNPEAWKQKMQSRNEPEKVINSLHKEVRELKEMIMRQSQQSQVNTIQEQYQKYHEEQANAYLRNDIAKANEIEAKKFELMKSLAGVAPVQNQPQDNSYQQNDDDLIAARALLKRADWMKEPSMKMVAEQIYADLPDDMGEFDKVQEVDRRLKAQMNFKSPMVNGMNGSNRPQYQPNYQQQQNFASLPPEIQAQARNLPGVDLEVFAKNFYKLNKK